MMMSLALGCMYEALYSWARTSEVCWVPSIQNKWMLVTRGVIPGSGHLRTRPGPRMGIPSGEAEPVHCSRYQGVDLSRSSRQPTANQCHHCEHPQLRCCMRGVD